jgi:DNA polymerase III subunit epsilon
MTTTTANKLIHEMPMLGVDTETTGRDSRTARLVTASLIFSVPGEETITMSWLVNPGVEIPKEASDVHGISTEHAKLFGRSPFEVLTEIAAEIEKWVSTGNPLVAYNAPYDFTLLREEFLRHGVEFNGDFGKVLDPYVMDKWLDKWRKGKRNLSAASSHYGVELLDAHSADADALAAVGVARAICRKFKISSSLSDFHDAQMKQKEIQSADLQAYLRRNDPTAVVEGSWPVLSSQ